MLELGGEIAIQAKLKSVQVVLGPNLNLHRDPRRGRNFETFSEDPLLTGKLAAAIVNGIPIQRCWRLCKALCRKRQ
jgi:beta-glucosidase